MRHMAQITDRAERGNLGQAIGIEQGDELICYFKADTRMPMSEIVDRRSHDRARLGNAQRRADADCVAHQNVARQRALLGWRHDHVAQRAHAGIHAIRANAALDDLLDKYARRCNARARVGGKLERFAGGNRRHLGPVERTIGTDHGHDGALRAK